MCIRDRTAPWSLLGIARVCTGLGVRASSKFSDGVHGLHVLPGERIPRHGVAAGQCYPSAGLFVFVRRIENLFRIDRVKFQRFTPLHSNTTHSSNSLTASTTAAAFIIQYVRLCNIYIHPRYSQACAKHGRASARHTKALVPEITLHSCVAGKPKPPMMLLCLSTRASTTEKCNRRSL